MSAAAIEGERMTDLAANAKSTASVFLVIRPPSRWAPFNLRELWQFRDLLVRFVVRDLTLRYRQTALGVIWVVLQPLLAAGAFAFVFGTRRRPVERRRALLRVRVRGHAGVERFQRRAHAHERVARRQRAARVEDLLPAARAAAVDASARSSSTSSWRLAMMVVIWPVAGVVAGLEPLTLPVWLAGGAAARDRASACSPPR